MIPSHSGNSFQPWHAYAQLFRVSLVAGTRFGALPGYKTLNRNPNRLPASSDRVLAELPSVGLGLLPGRVFDKGRVIRQRLGSAKVLFVGGHPVACQLMLSCFDIEITAADQRVKPIFKCIFHP